MSARVSLISWAVCTCKCRCRKKDRYRDELGGKLQCVKNEKQRLAC